MSTIEKVLNKLNDSKHVDQGREAGTDVGVAEATAVADRPEKTRHAILEDSGRKLSGGNAVQLNYQRLEAAGILAPNNSESHIRDEFRNIKRPLLSNAFGKSASLVDRGNLIMVTSSLSGEGKTFTAVNLALSITLERDHTVLLIDADVAKSDVTQLFELEQNPGLIDVLLDETLSVGDVLVRTDVPSLTIIPAGRHHSEITELLASKRMAWVMGEIAERYSDRVIIIDAPPLLVTTEAQQLVDVAGQIAFVIRAGDTPKSVVESAIATLGQNKAIGLILNQAQRMFGADHGGSGYYGHSSTGHRERA